MKNIIYLSIALFLFSCKKEKDITGQDFIVTASAKIWSKDKQEFAPSDSAKFIFYESQTDSIPYKILYTGLDGSCQITLKGDRDYYFTCITPHYKNSSGLDYSYTPKTSVAHSTKEKNDKKHTYIPGDFYISFIQDQIEKTNPQSSTNLIHDDPINF